jgi:hypothetical protein
VTGLTYQRDEKTLSVSAGLGANTLSVPLNYSFFFWCGVILRFKLKVLHLLGKGSTTWTMPSAIFALGYFLDRVFHSPPHTSYLLSLKPSFRSWSFHNLWFSWEDSCSSPGLLSSWDYSCEPPHPAPSTNYSYCFFGVPTLWITPGDGGFFGVFNLSTCLLYVYLNHFIPRVPIFLV